MLATAALALALAAGSPAVQPAEEGTILRRAHDDSGMGFGPVSRTPSEFPERATTAAQPQDRPGTAGFGYYYQWNPTTEQWDVHYGYHTARYQFGPPPAADRGAPAIAEQPAISGTIEDVRTTILHPVRRPVALASLRLRDGTSRLVSLGRADDIARLRLRNGEFVTVRGRQNFVDGQPVFMVTGLAVDGQTFSITQPVDIAGQNPPGPRPRLDPQSQPTRWREPTRQQQMQPMRRQGERTRWDEEEWDTTRSRPFSSPVGRAIEVPRTARAGGWDQADTGQQRTDTLRPPTTGVGQGEAGEIHLFPAGYSPERYDVRWRTTESGTALAPVSSASQLAGSVQELYFTNVPGMREEELVVRLTVSGAPGRLVSLGTGLTPYQLDQLESARSIEVQGRTVDIGGYPVLLAERITADGSTFGVRHGGD